MPKGAKGFKPGPSARRFLGSIGGGGDGFNTIVCRASEILRIPPYYATMEGKIFEICGFI
uniref:Uncharacterized protein n=1 Tax=Leersia perrieri TaxID=77586 RepID=A0A0D9VB30_9ORYZ